MGHLSIRPSDQDLSLSSLDHLQAVQESQHPDRPNAAGPPGESSSSHSRCLTIWSTLPIPLNSSLCSNNFQDLHHAQSSLLLGDAFFGDRHSLGATTSPLRGLPQTVVPVHNPSSTIINSNLRCGPS